MMGTPTTSIVMEELLNLGVTTFIRVGTTGGFRPLNIGDVVVALAAAGATGMSDILGRRRGDGADGGLRGRQGARGGVRGERASRPTSGRS